MKMMNKIFKTPASPHNDPQAINATRVLSIGEQHGMMMLWFESTDDPSAFIEYVLIGTGWTIPGGFIHKKTLVFSDGFVWHLMVRPDESETH